MMELEKLQEALVEAERAGDLRRKETLRLIENASAVLERVLEVARQANVQVEVELWEEKEKESVFLLEVGPARKHYFRGWTAKVLEKDSGYEWNRWEIAADPEAEDTIVKNIPENDLGLPTGIHRVGYPVGTVGVYIDGKYYERGREFIKNLPGLHPSEANSLDTIPRKWWIKIAHAIPDLVFELHRKAKEMEAETKAAADLAEKIKKAITE